MNAQRVADILQRHNVQYAVVGGIAVIARGYLRVTRDVDFLTTASSILTRATWSELEQLATVEVRRGDFDDPMRGVIRIFFSPEDNVDVVVAKYRWQQDIIARSEPLDIGGFIAPVPTVPDLIRLKLFAGGGIDQQDILALLERGNRAQIVAEVDEHIGALPEDAQKLWAKLRAE